MFATPAEKIAPTAAVVHAAIASGTDGTFTTSDVVPLPVSGYYVGGKASLVGRRDTFTPESVTRFVGNVTTGYVGVWTDADGTVYVDETEHYHSERLARRIAEQRGELSVWDIANAREIHVTTVLSAAR